MPTEVYEEDSRTPCQYGAECYQKNPAHHTKYKHPPKKQQNNAKTERNINTGRKRTSSECDDESSSTTSQPQAKLKKNDNVSVNVKEHSLSPSPTEDSEASNPKTENNCKSEKDSLSGKNSATTAKNDSTSADDFGVAASKSEIEEKKANEEATKLETSDASSSDPKEIIRSLFLTDMPDDFYKFYDFCKTLFSKDPSGCLKLVDLKLVGPYDVLGGKVAKNHRNEPEKYLRHWRYYYDPPEFQTILRGNDKEGLHYGYWRDVIEDLPVFVAKNSANKDCNIEPIAPNIFGAVNKHIGDKIARANPFEKGPMVKLSRQLKTFAKDNGVSLDTESSEMRGRARKVVAKTFHGAGIVVPYDKKTQLGYRDLAATDSQLKRILKKIDEADSDDERGKAMVSLEEIVRLATIAADESDFGTCLELGHDLFSSGVVHVQRVGLRVLATAYNLLNRQKFLNIAEAHAKDRKKGCELGVL